ncbi:iron complex outermembrane receptor protein [Neolewinella xylanilytica]|uniref:Iron complex outermembrane receptor protein n=1 Tax=Neolewinella xylanilytica TaxID=1514080 RepID=A0A2S6I3H3_9BACT|nr:TonB-dependent receptor [Neolewinella xylanilytica]PPK85715.1 iron complex outermembrane receptor protein [Neolewinella xylanilytica]
MYRVLFLLMISGAVGAQVDTLYTLPDATVTAFRDEVASYRVGASVSTLEERELQLIPTADLLPAMNRLPGVRFEQRAPGSYRISVRGSTLRSPFGVRNIKIYWNGIPFTEPGGDTPLNFLDVANIDRVELIRGPAGSLYGAGTAGTLLFSTDTLEGHADAGVAGGSYGFFRAGAQVQWGPGNGRGTNGQPSYQLRLSHQQTDGYRAQSALSRQTAQFSTRWRMGTTRSLQLHALYTNLYYELPGGLNAEQYAADRRQARPGSETTQASINYDNLLLGLTHDWSRGRWSNVTTVYGTGFYFDHPFNFDYKRETNLGTGGRTAFDYTLPLAGSILKLSAGAETQLQMRMANNFGNETGTPSQLNFSDEILSTQYILFAQAAYDLGDWRFALGLSFNDLRYRVDRTFDAAATPAITESSIEPVASPRISVLRDFGGYSVYATVSSGFSPPTLDEYRTNEGSINVSLQPERGTNYEIGTKGAWNGLVEYELALFYLRLDNAISTYSDARGTQLFRNAGSTDQRGLEMALRYQPALWLDLYGSYTYHDFSYGSYERSGEDYSGNPLPGTAPHVVNLEATASLPAGFYAVLTENYTDAIPLNDDNSVFGEAYHLLRARLGWRGDWAGKRLDVYVGGSNLLDQAMSFGNDLNPQFGGRYYQPAPGRNWFLGARASL